MISLSKSGFGVSVVRQLFQLTKSSSSLFHPERLLASSSSSSPSSLASSNYDAVYRRSLEHPEDFWGEVAGGVQWMKPFEKVLDHSDPPFTKWFVGGTLNTSYNALDRHVLRGNGERTAIIYDSPIAGKKVKFTYRELRERVSRMAGALSSLGVQKGDVVIIYMGMIPETVIAMLAAARIGAVHNLVFGGFAAPQLSARIDHSKPKVAICASVGLEPSRVIDYKEILDEAIRLSSHSPKHCIVLNREGFERASLTPSRDLDWEELEARSRPHDPVPVGAQDPAYIIYTSGTTGTPKGVVRPTGGHTVVLPWTMKAIYDMSPEDVWWAASDFGWVVGHSYICYAPLLNGNTTIIYEGKPVGTPDAHQFFRVVREYGVRGLFVAPTALRVIARELPSEEDVLKGTPFQYLYVAGEPLDHTTRLWSEKAFGVPTLDHWWQTETGFPITAHCMGLGMSREAPRGTTGKPFMGFDIRILNEKGEEAMPGELGRIVSKLPLPPGNFSTLFQADSRFKETYFSKFEGFYDTMDVGIKSQEGYISVQARDDDVINVAGHRLSTLSLEEAILSHKDVIEAAVIGVPDDIKGELPLGMYVTNKDCQKTEE
ncbi:UNVERIFIED_CONTAM: hypothetical protein GTU68_050729, partial [Idotea baltica]|nr:hypothetical protein [Idotea baltica]